MPSHSSVSPLELHSQRDLPGPRSQLLPWGYLASNLLIKAKYEDLLPFHQIVNSSASLSQLKTTPKVLSENSGIIIPQ